MQKLLLGVIVVVVVVVGILLVRTVLHIPENAESIEKVDIPLDETRIAQHLSEAIRFRTVSFQDSDKMDVDEFNAFIDWVKATWPEVHNAMELVQLNHTLLFKWQGSNPSLKPILVTGHYDVVPISPGSESQWQHPPFDGEIVDGIIWGRGALDDKSGVIAILEAATYLIGRGFTPARTVYLSFGHDEEVGGTRGAGAVRQYLEEADIQLSWSLDEGSFVFDEMLPMVEPLMAPINVAEKGSVTLEIVARAQGGHSSMPPRRTAVGMLAEAITKLENQPVPGGLSGLPATMFDTVSRHMSFGYRMLFANRWLFGGIIEDQLSAQPETNAMLRTTTAPTMLSGSIKTNVLPTEARAAVNFRIHPRDSVDSVLDYVMSVVSNDSVKVVKPEGSGRPASKVSDWKSPGYKVIERSVREVYGEVVVTPGLMIAGSDTRHYGQVADNAFRFNPMVVTKEDLTGFHGTNEKISAESLAQGTRSYIRIIEQGASQE